MPRSMPVSARRRGFRPTVDHLEDRWLLTTVPRGYVEATVAHGLTRPTAFIALAPDGRLFVAQQDGQVRIIQNGKLLPTPFLSLNVDSTQELGLVGIALDPNFETNPYVYVYYTVPGSAGIPAHNRVSRFLASGDLAVPGSEQDLLDLPGFGRPNHVAGALHFGADGKLYIGVGDNLIAQFPVAGYPVRQGAPHHADGSIPTDNPFYNVTTGVNRAIWALGLRNPFTSAFQPGTGLFFINDVGEDTWEKIEVGTTGANYGWPVSENPQGIPGLQSPVYAYMHGPHDRNGLAHHRRRLRQPGVPGGPQRGQGSYFFTDLCGDWIHRLDLATGHVTTFATKLPTFTLDLIASPTGQLYVLCAARGRTPTGTTTAWCRRDPPSSLATGTVARGPHGHRRLLQVFQGDRDRRDAERGQVDPSRGGAGPSRARHGPMRDATAALNVEAPRRSRWVRSEKTSPR